MENEIQFDQVQQPTGGSACGICRGALLDSYYQANGKILCERCAEKIRTYFQSKEGAGGRLALAAVLGLGGGIAGGAVYTALLAYTSINAALVTILIGWLVGKGVRKGSGNRGGVEFQILAVVITYVIIGFSFVAAEGIASAGGSLDLTALLGVSVSDALMAPFTNATSTLLGGVITFFGLMQAWRLTKAAQVVITGPHTITTAYRVVPAAPEATPERTAPPSLPSTEPPPAPSA